MSQEFKTIAIVEDDDYFYRQMLPFLMPLEIEILRADNRNDTMKLIGELSEEVFWIVDGNFPKFN